MEKGAHIIINYFADQQSPEEKLNTENL